MTPLLAQLQEWMHHPENEHLEFKEAKNRFDFEKLVKYCAALANEGGGRMILGITDQPPRRVTGTQAFLELERTKAGLIDRLRLRIDAETIAHPDGRVIVINVPPRPMGVPIQYEGAYWMRAGEGLVPMTPDMLRRIFAESGPDFSAEICPNATLSDLDPAAIERFRAMWRRRSGNPALDAAPVEQLLADVELTIDGELTFAALILLGTRAALGRRLAQSEVIFEYRSGEVSGPAQQRIEYRQGFLLFLDELWTTINLRNDRQHFQDGLVMLDIATFNETAVRESILNAVCHRDYQQAGSVFVRQYTRRLEIVSPGGFLPGITPENVLWKQAPRNRRIAEAVARCGLVERAGQGIDRIFEECIKESKPRPDFAGTDDYQVAVTLRGEIEDPRFLRFLEQVRKEGLFSFSTQDLLVLDFLHHGLPIPQDLRRRIAVLEEQGVIESIRRGEFILSRRFYSFLGQPGVYTRKRGLDKETNKALLLKHIQDNRVSGSQLPELLQVLPALSRAQVKRLLRELREDGRIRFEGRTKSGRWLPCPDRSEENHDHASGST